MENIGIHWFRKGLRIHDNKALSESSAQCSHLLPVYVIEEKRLNPMLIGTNRFGFLLETLKCLDSGLRKKGSRLIVVQAGMLHAFFLNVLNHVLKNLNTWANIISYHNCCIFKYYL